MSFGSSISDIALLVQLAYKTTQGARAACGEYDELTRETSSLHILLNRLHVEVTKPGGSINRRGGTYGQELRSISGGCEDVLTQLDKILVKYNALSEQERSARRLWKKIRFGTGAVADVAELRSRVTYFTSALTLFLNLISVGTVGEVEKKMDRAGGDLKDIKIAINSITARLMATAGHEGSVMTAYTNDDRDAWRELRRGLASDGFSDSLIRKHKKKIMAYVKELGNRGILDTGGADEFEERVIMPREQDSSSTTSLMKPAASVLESPGAGSPLGTSPLSHDPSFSSSKDTMESKSVKTISTDVASSTVDGELKPSPNGYSVNIDIEGCAETTAGGTSEITPRKKRPGTSVHALLVVRDSPAEQQSLNKPKGCSRQAYFESGSETEDGVTQAQSNRDLTSPTGSPCTSDDITARPVSDDHERCGITLTRPDLFPTFRLASPRNRYDSNLDNNAIAVGESPVSRVEKKLDEPNIRNHKDALPKPPVDSTGFPRFVAAETVIYDTLHLVMIASYVLQHFRSKFEYLSALGLPQKYFINMQAGEETDIRPEDLGLLEDIVKSSFDLLLDLERFVRVHFHQRRFTPSPTNLSSYSFEEVIILCERAIETFKRQISNEDLSYRTDQIAFYNSTIIWIDRWNYHFDEVYYRSPCCGEPTCGSIFCGPSSSREWLYGRLRPAKSCRMGRVREWDDGYSGVIDVEHWMTSQGISHPSRYCSSVTKLPPDDPYLPHTVKFLRLRRHLASCYTQGCHLLAENEKSAELHGNLIISMNEIYLQLRPDIDHYISHIELPNDTQIARDLDALCQATIRLSVEWNIPLEP